MTIHYLTPYATDKNFGAEMNTRISELSAGWICLRDSDACFLTPEYGNQIAEVCASAEFTLIGCMTNRLGRPIQRDEDMYNEWDMRKHYERAVKRQSEDWGVVEDITHRKFVAGMFMLFHKSTWEKVKFKENCITWDDQFSKEVTAMGGKLGLMKGLYMFHWYRGNSDFPLFANGHLINR